MSCSVGVELFSFVLIVWCSGWCFGISFFGFGIYGLVVLQTQQDQIWTDIGGWLFLLEETTQSHQWLDEFLNILHTTTVLVGDFFLFRWFLVVVLKASSYTTTVNLQLACRFEHKQTYRLMGQLPTISADKRGTYWCLFQTSNFPIGLFL